MAPDIQSHVETEIDTCDCRRSVKFGQGVPAVVHSLVRKPDPIPAASRACRDVWILYYVPFLSKLAYAVAPILS